MAKCRALTKAGKPCHNEALPGSDYCRFHQALAGQPAEGAQPEENMVIRTEPLKVRIRYIGEGTYQVADYLFTPEEREHEVPEKLAELLLENEKNLFEEA